MAVPLTIKTFTPSQTGYPIIGFQSPHTRALNVGFFRKINGKLEFIPCRLNFGAERQMDTHEAAVQTLQLPEAQTLLKQYPEEQISTIALLRETLSCNLPMALYRAGIRSHYGDAYIGANHIKTKNSIVTKYTYENTEGLIDHGLWILSDSIAEGRNLIATLSSLLSKFHPKHILIIVPIGNRLGINKVGDLLQTNKVDATFVVWGALFGLEPTMHYDEPWGLPDCEPIDPRDQKTFISMYGPELCVGGDFGNDYYCPPRARVLYEEQLKLHHIIPHIPTAKEILSVYKQEEFITR